ncbi:MAG: hypothetical protein ACRBI6_14330 [Acidimicrobiales bacterium]
MSAADLPAPTSRWAALVAWYRRALPVAVQVVLLVAGLVLAIGAALSPLVFLLRRTGVG